MRTMRDVKALDEARREREEAGKNRYTYRPGAQRRVSRRQPFHNLEEHGYDYNEIVWDVIHAGEKTGGNDGAE